MSEKRKRIRQDYEVSPNFQSPLVEDERLDAVTCPLLSDVQRRKSPVCGFVTPLQGSEADEHRKPEVAAHPSAYTSRGSLPQWGLYVRWDGVWGD